MSRNQSDEIRKNQNNGMDKNQNESMSKSQNVRIDKCQNTRTAKNHSAGSKTLLSGEAALAAALVINTLGVNLMLYSGFGSSAISSLPYAFSLVLPQLSLGTWTYLFQGLLVLTLMVLKKRFVPPYLFSFVVGFVFGKLLDFHEM